MLILKEKFTVAMLEVCVDSAASAVAAARGGADHIELCSSLAEGGLTPSVGLLRVVQRTVKDVKINVMIRCRPGSDFCYLDSEMDTMLADVEIFKDMAVDGFVFGALTLNQEIDKASCAKIIEKAGSIPVTFHRAFDACRDPLNSLETVIALGFKKLLTSGQKSSAVDKEAVELIEELVKKSDNRVLIMPGAGITDKNIEVLKTTGAKYFHSSCKIARYLPKVHAPAMGPSESEIINETDLAKVRELKNQLKLLFPKK